MKMHQMKGLSFTVALGKWAKPHIRVADYSARLCLGFVAFTFYTLDLEVLITRLAKEAAKSKEGIGETE